MPPRRCQGCPVCGVTLTRSPDTHETPKPHEWITQYDTNTGLPYEICMYCTTEKGKRRSEDDQVNLIEKFLELWPDSEWGPAHIVLSDYNLELEDLDSCLNHIETYDPKNYSVSHSPEELEATRAFLLELKG